MTENLLKFFGSEMVNQLGVINPGITLCRFLSIRPPLLSPWLDVERNVYLYMDRNFISK